MEIPQKTRKIAANYIFLPGKTLLKNGYVVWCGGSQPQLIDTGGQLRDMAELEFYGGMIVPAYVCEHERLFVVGQPFLRALEDLYRQRTDDCLQLAIIEGADLKEFIWKVGTRIRKL